MNPESRSLASYIRTVPDFPKQGIMFRDITTLLKDAHAFQQAVEVLYARYKGERISKVVCVESRGFILGAASLLKISGAQLWGCRS
jgi:adenine phosphoribosyltransferase